MCFILGAKTLQQFSGTIGINSYTKTIFNEVESSLDSKASSVISTFIAVPAGKLTKNSKNTYSLNGQIKQNYFIQSIKVYALFFVKRLVYIIPILFTVLEKIKLLIILF